MDLAKRYEKELPKMEKQLLNLKKGTNNYNSLNHEIKMHKMVIKEVLDQ